MKKTLTTTGLALALMAVPAMAQDGEEPARSTAAGHGKGSFMETYDKDGDGKVSLEEFRAGRADKYKGFDLDGDGEVTEEEYVTEYKARLDLELARRRAMQIRQAYVRYGVLDTNEDKNLTLDEFHESGARMFSRLDTNGDGVVDETDTAKAY